MDDWSNDASFDLASIDTSLALLPQASGNSASSSPSRAATSGNIPKSRPRGHRSSSSFSSRSSTSSLAQSPVQINSPLRHSFTRDTDPINAPKQALAGAKSKGGEEEGDVDFDDGFEDAFGDAPPIRTPLSLGVGKGGTMKLGNAAVRGVSSTSTGSMQGITSSGTVMGVGPKGIGTITRLGSTPSNSSLSNKAGTAGPSKPTNLASVKARAKAWEADLGLDDGDDGFGDIGDFATGANGGNGTVKGGKVQGLGSLQGGASGTGGGLQLKLPNRPLPPPEDLNDLGFDLSDDERKEDDATLKAGNTIKAMLPPPRPKTGHGAGASKGFIPPPGTTTAGMGKPDQKAQDGAEGDFDMEADIVLPLNLTNLVLATKSHPTARNHAPADSAAAGATGGAGGKKGPRYSDASDTFGSISTGTNEWDLDPPKSRPQLQTPKDKGTAPSMSSRTLYSANTSMSEKLKYYSETSATSVDEPAELSSPSPSATYKYGVGHGDTIKASAHAKGLIRPGPGGTGGGVIGAADTEWQEDDLEGDIESGLVLPDPSFFSFSVQRSKELNGILDKRRKQHYAPAPDVVAAAAQANAGGRRSAPGYDAEDGQDRQDELDGTGRRDENMEDGFVFDNPTVELSNTRLKTQRRMRGGEPIPLPTTSRGKRDRDGPGLRSIARSKEAGWRYQASAQGQAQSIGAQKDRSESPLVSAAATTTANASPYGTLPSASSRDASNPTPTPNRPVQVGSTRTRTQSAMHGAVSSMFAAPGTGQAAAAPGTGIGTITPGRLRYQKSHHHISARGTSGNGGRSTSPTPLGHAAGGAGGAMAGGLGGTLGRKQSLASLQDAMKRAGTPSRVGSGGSPFTATTAIAVGGGGTGKSVSAFAAIPHGHSHAYSALSSTTSSPSTSTGTGTGGGIDGLPGSSSSASIGPFATPSKSTDRERERYHASTSRLTMPTSSSRAKTRPPIAGLFNRPGADSPGPGSGASGGQGLAMLAEVDPLVSRRVSPSRTGITGTTAGAGAGATPSRGSLRRLVEPAQLLIPLSKRKQPSHQQSTTSTAGAVTSAANTGSFGRKMRQWGDGSELEGIEDLVVDDHPPQAEDHRKEKEKEKGQGSIGKSGKGSVGRSGGIGLGRPSMVRKESNQDAPATHRFGTAADDKDREKRHKSKARGEAEKGTNAKDTGSGSMRRKTKRPAMLIKHLGGVDKRKVVGEMTWNPHTLRWEGNESILASFDPPAPSISPTHSRPNSKTATRPARPALITHLTPSSIGLASSGSIPSIPSNLSTIPPTAAAAKILTSPDKDRYSTVRIVGDMQFDPQKMCWVSLVPEEDAFEGMADDEDDEWGFAAATGGGGGGGTIRGSKGLMNIHGNNQGQGRMSSTSTANTDWTQGTSGTQISLATAGSGSTSGPGAGATGGPYRPRPRESFGSEANTSPGKSSTLGSSLGGAEGDGEWQAAISPELWAECQAAEERHRKEVKGWCVRPMPPMPTVGSGNGRSVQVQQVQWAKDVQERERREGKRLWEIRNLAMRS